MADCIGRIAMMYGVDRVASVDRVKVVGRGSYCRIGRLRVEDRAATVGRIYRSRLPAAAVRIRRLYSDGRCRDYTFSLRCDADSHEAIL